MATTGEAAWRRRALDAEAAIRSMAGMLQEIDREPMSPASYVGSEREQAAVRRAMRNHRRSRRRVTKTLEEVLADLEGAT